MFPFSGGTNNFLSDIYTGLMQFPNGNFSFPLLPCQMLPLVTDVNFQQPEYSSGSDNLAKIDAVTIRMIMSGKEVGCIIGKKGDNVKKFREQSGARINISDGSCPERVVSVSGSVDKVSSAFLLICQKFEDDYIAVDRERSDPYICPPVTLRLLVPATQCGSIIGKGGCKIKEIRDMCGSSIQVASELLPSSSERSVTVSGTASSVAKCIKQICLILLETPAKFGTVQYKPKNPFGITPQPLPHTHSIRSLVPFNQSHPEVMKPMSSLDIPQPIALFPMPSSISGHIIPQNVVPTLLNNNNFSGPIPIWLKPQHLSPYPHTPDPHNQPIISHPSGPQQMVEISIPNDLIGCIIGRCGNTINEIRSMSGAQIKISDSEDTSTERRIIISGSGEAITTAQLLINSNILSYRNTLNCKNPDVNSNANNSGTGVPLNTISSQGPPPKHPCIYGSHGKWSSSHFSVDGNKRLDHIQYNPY